MKLKSYIEVYLEKPDDFTLSLVELESDATVWKAKLRESESLGFHHGFLPAGKMQELGYNSAHGYTEIPAVKVVRFGAGSDKTRREELWGVTQGMLQ